MKATGIVRRIDELGRVVIPKEIRRTLRIREGDSLEIYTDRSGGVILKKYSLIGELGGFTREYAESIRRSVGHIALIADKDQLVAACGSKKEQSGALAVGTAISDELEELITERRILDRSAARGEEMIKLTAADGPGTGITAQLVIPVISAGDPIGAVILAAKDKGAEFGEADRKVAETAAFFIGTQMEN